MNPIKACQLPPNTLVGRCFNRIDYVDTFRTVLPSDNHATIEDLARAFFSGTPTWVKGLMGLRNRLVGWLGLKTGQTPLNEAIQIPSNQRFDAGTQLGIFKIYDRSTEEIVMGEDDRHLNFRVGLILREEDHHRVAFITTVVRFNNWLGRAYFLPVKHFHQLIVPAMFKQMVRRSQAH